MTCCTLTKLYGPAAPVVVADPPPAPPPPEVPPQPPPTYSAPPVPAPPRVSQPQPSYGCTTQSCCVLELLKAKAINPNISSIKCP